MSRLRPVRDAESQHALDQADNVTAQVEAACVDLEESTAELQRTLEEVKAKRGPGRPAIGPLLAGVRLEAGMLAEIDDLAADADVPRSDVVRELLGEALAARRRKAARKGQT